jgi:isoaspartyl peptidase/L-asparaginase-like protein (Ntn-hydrolase superfamily)
MKPLYRGVPLIIATLFCGLGNAAEGPIALAIHGGAGISRAELTAEQEVACREKLVEALRAGHKILGEGGASLDAVQAAIVILEDSPLFNAGRGSALTSEGTAEMDASIMDGKTRKAGAVAAITGIRNPILLARMVMEQTPHVLLAGAGAEAFARQNQLQFETRDYFITPQQQEKLRRAKERKSANNQHDDDLTALMGTVGAVALDRQGRLAAGTSTGGLTNKLPGRVGDSPIIGVGNYAENGVCAVSGTGQGEYFMRAVVAHDLAARIKYGQQDLVTAARTVVHETLTGLGGKGGIIAIDAAGNVTSPFNTPGMFHGWIKADGTVHVAIFEE